PAPTPPPLAAYSPPDVSGRAAFAAPRRQDSAPAPQAAPAAIPESAVPLRPTAPATRDNLQRISGIDNDAEKALAVQGVSRYSQIAHWSPGDVTRMEALLGASGRIGRENWIEQAQILGRGGDTAFSREYDRRTRGETPAALAPTKPAAAIAANSGQSGEETPRQV